MPSPYELRSIAALLAIAAILLLGGLFWSSLGALAAASDQARSALPGAFAPPPLLRGATPAVAAGAATPVPPPGDEAVASGRGGLGAATSPSPSAAAAPATAPAAAPAAPTAAPHAPARVQTAAPTLAPAVSATPAPPAAPSADPTPRPGDPTPRPGAEGRAPWVLLPQPPPDGQIAAGPVTVEARGRGDAPIAEIRLELDGTILPVALEQRGESIWRGSATVPIGPGRHTVRAVVVDARGRSGAFRWSFDAVR